MQNGLGYECYGIWDGIGYRIEGYRRLWRMVWDIPFSIWHVELWHVEWTEMNCYGIQNGMGYSNVNGMKYGLECDTE